jgi:adhesin/invasin
MKVSRFSAPLLLALAAACGPKSPAPNVQCVVDSDCFSGGVCIAGGTCRFGASIDPQASTVEVSQPSALADGSDKVTITVTLKDSAGNLLVNRGVQLAADGKNNTLTQPTLPTNSAGQATGTLVSTSAGVQTITAMTGSQFGPASTDKTVTLKSSASVTFTADAGHLAAVGTGASASTLTVTASDGVSAADVLADGATNIVARLTVRDAHGNPVPGVKVFLNVTGTGNTVSPQGVTAANGTFSGTVTSTTAEAKTLVVTAAALHAELPINFHAVQCNVDTDCFGGGVCIAGGTCRSGAPVDPLTSIIDVSQVTALADGSDKITVTVTLKDSAGNPLSSRGVQLAATGVNNVLSQPVLSTNSMGQVSGSLISTTAEVKTVTAFTGSQVGLGANSTSLPLKGSVAVTFIADAAHLAPVGTGPGASTISVTAVDGSVANVVADGATPVVVKVTLKDAHGNLVPGVPVFLDASGSANTLSPQGATGADGSYTGVVASTKAEGKLLIVTAGSLHAEQEIAFHAGLAAAAKSKVTVDKPSISAVGDASTTVATISVEAHDAFDNLCPAALIYFEGTSTALGTFSPTVQKAEPASTLPDGSLSVAFSSPRAEVKNLTVHLDDATLPLTITVTAGPPSDVTSQFQIIGNVDESPVIANGNQPNPSSYVLVAYVADLQDNPIAGKTVSFTSGVPSDLILDGDGQPGGTQADGTFAAQLTAIVAGSAEANTAHEITANIQDLPALSALVDFAPGPPDGGRSFLRVTPDFATGSISTDSGNSASVQLVLVDANGNPSPSDAVTIDATGSSNTFSVPAQNNSSYTLQLASSVAEKKTVTADVVVSPTSTLHLAQDVLFVAGAVSAANSTVAFTTAGTPTADGTTLVSATVTLRDAQGNPVPGISVLGNVVPGGGVTSLFAPAATNAAGTTTISFGSTAAETKTLSINLGGLVLAQTAQITFGPGLPSAGNSAFTAAPATVIASDPTGATLTLIARDSRNNPVPNAAISFSSSAPAGAFTFTPGTFPIATDAHGVVTLKYTTSSSAAPQSIIATGAGGFSLSTTVTARSGAVSATNSSMTAAPTTTVANGSNLITLTVTEKDGSQAPNPIVGHTIALSWTNPNGNIAVSNAVTDVNGKMTGTVSSKQTGPFTVTASDTTSGGTAFASTVVTFTAGQPAQANTSFSAAPTSVVADASSAITVTTTVRDANGNGVPGAAVSYTSDDTIDDTFQCPAGSVCTAGAGNPITVTTNAAGVAVAKVVSRKTGTRNVLSTVGFTLRSSVTFTPGAPARLTFSRSPADVAAGAAINAAVALQDQFGNAVPTGSASVTIGLVAVSPTTGTLGPAAATVASTVSGVATFNSASVTGAAGPRQLVATAPGLASATSGTFNVIAPFGSTGADGAFNPQGSMSLPARVYNYTTINIPAGARITSDGNGVLELRATGAVTIGGVLDVSGGNGGAVTSGVNGGGGGGGAGTTTAGANGAYDASNFGGARAPGGGGGNGPTPWAAAGAVGGGGLPGYGGAAMGGGGGGGSANGNADMNAGAGAGGGGAAGGAGGFAGADGCVAYGGAGGGPNGGGTTGCGAAGAGGGAACGATYAGTNGGVGSSPCTTISGSGGGGAIGCDAAADQSMASTLRPGSGGGGGGNGGDSNEPGSGQRSGGGGGGGGGGGALRIVSPVSIVLSSGASILANGGNGGSGGVSIDDCNDDAGGAGGGGSGGAIWLQAPTLTVPAGATLSAHGGVGGVAGATAAGASGGTGGLGRLRLSFDPAVSTVSGTVNPALPPANTNAAGKAFVAHYPQ